MPKSIKIEIPKEAAVSICEQISASLGDRPPLAMAAATSGKCITASLDHASAKALHAKIRKELVKKPAPKKKTASRKNPKK